MPRKTGTLEKSGHPLPGSAEAHIERVPEDSVREKGRGDDPLAPSTPDEGFRDPAGKPYPAEEGP